MNNLSCVRRVVSSFAPLAAVFAIAAPLGAFPAITQAADPLRLLPGSTAAYVEITRPEALIDPLLAPQTVELLAGIDAYQMYLQSKQYGELQGVVGLLETKLGVDWQAGLRDLVGGGVHLAFDPADKAAVFIVRSRKPELLKQLHESLIELIESDAETKSKPSPVKSKEYKGVTGWQFGPGEVHVLLDDLLVVSNKQEALKAVIDRYGDASAQGLAAATAFKQAHGKKPAEALGWAWVSLEVARQAPNVQKALDGPSDNPLIELLIGGVLDAMKRAPFATAGLSLEGGKLRLRAELPRDPAKTAAMRAWYFSGEGEQQAPLAVRPPQTIAAFGLFRDLAGLWLARDELFNEKVTAGFAQADTQLGLFFSGRDFGPEVLGELAPQLQFVVARQEFSSEQPIPALKLPAMALVLRMKHPEEFSTQLLIAYQKVVGLANVVGGQKGQPQLLLATEEYHGATISKATYLREGKEEPGQAKVNYNFSPSCVRVGDAFVYGSTVGITRQMVDLLAQTNAATSANASLSVIGAPLAAVLSDNRELMIAQNMLSEGHTREEAEMTIDTLLKLARLAEKAELKLAAESETLALEASVDIGQP
ncbi:MAG TPA: DUF3352 domain-containing protein [Pirellulales bacterium]|nr:DUF3352 domain-containing protein [Pirellulales bacterium]